MSKGNRNTRSWKHLRKDRKQYDIHPADVYAGDLAIPFITEFIYKHNTPFMQDDMDLELMAEG